MESTELSMKPGSKKVQTMLQDLRLMSTICYSQRPKQKSEDIFLVKER